MQDVKPNLYGPRKIGRGAFEAQQERQVVSQREATVYGKRKAGARAAPRVAPKRPAARPPENPFVERGTSDRIPIRAGEQLLDANPDLLDLAIETELSLPDARKGMVEALRKFEQQRAGGPRASVMKLLAAHD